MSRLRVVVVCMDEFIASDEGTLNKFRAAVGAGLALIAVICPGYKFPKTADGGDNFSSWWPDTMRELHKHALFVDARNLERLPAKVGAELWPQVYKFLEGWRGQAPDPTVFKDAADRIICVECVKECAATPHVFRRSACEDKLAKASAQINAAASATGGEGACGESEEGASTRGGVTMERCSNGHEADLRDILSQNVIFEAVLCPACVQAGQVPPHCFNRSSMLHKLSEEELGGARTGAVECPTCAEAGRPSVMSILSVLSPEVFLSYNWGKQLSTQAIVKDMRPRIEQDADVVCWFDVGGGMGAGQSHFVEMEEGIRKSTVVVIFLSDAYCNSGNCVREFLHATKHSKYLIVVLVPDAVAVREGGPSSGWTGEVTGREDKSWWQHAAKICQCTDPDTGKPVSWAALGQFTPIDLRRMEPEAAVLEIVQRIQSRFHRGTHLLHTAQMYALWRRAAVLDSFLGSLHNAAQVEAAARELFARLDTDGNGKIDKKELMAGFPQLDAATASSLMAEADGDGDGFISVAELAAVIESVRVQVAGEGAACDDATGIRAMLRRRRQHLENIRAMLASRRAAQEAPEGSERGERTAEAEVESTEHWSALELARRSGQHLQAAADGLRELQRKLDS